MSNLTSSDVGGNLLHFLWDFRIMFYGVGPSEMGQPPPEYFLKAIPYFIMMIGAEALVAKKDGVKLYRINDTVCGLMLGLIQLFVGFFIKFLNFLAYIWVYENCRVLSLDQSSWLVWFIGILGIDMGYYWLHRCAHEFHMMWAAHSVHHTGEDYNLATALRQGALQETYGWIFKLPCALFVSPLVYSHHSALNTLYQFWIHTSFVGDLGLIEYVFNTPSHHRMHHRPPGNCNYAGVLIIWDVMFGTFVKEDEQKDYYGLAKQLNTFDPLAANVEHFRRLIKNTNPSKPRNLRFYLSLLCKRRVRAKWYFNPLDCFLPHKKKTIDGGWNVPKTPVRPKYDGLPSAKLGIFHWYTHFLTLVGLLFCLAVINVIAALTTQELCLLLPACFLFLCCLGRSFDGFEKCVGCNWLKVVYLLGVSAYLLVNDQMKNMNTISIRVFQALAVVDAVLWSIVYSRSGYRQPIKTE